MVSSKTGGEVFLSPRNKVLYSVASFSGFHLSLSPKEKKKNQKMTKINLLEERI